MKPPNKIQTPAVDDTSDGYFRQIVHDLTSGVIAIDRDGRIVAINPAALRHLGLEPGAIQQGDEFDRVESLAPFAPVLAQLLETKDDVSRREIVLGRDTLAAMEIGVSASLFDGPEEYNGAVLLFTDMTERRKLERAAAVNQQIVSLGELAAGVVHQLRNPLTIISGRAELLLRHVDNDPKSRESMNEILHETKILERSIAQFLRFAKPFEIRPARNHSSDIVGRTFQLCRQGADRKSVELAAEVPETIQPIYIDGARVAEALANIVSNAVDAVDDGGLVQICVEQDETNTVFKVLDNGPGVSLDSGQDLFSPFLTNKRDGTGLGLSIVQRIVTALGGTVGYDNREEGGARFVVTVPTVFAP